ncbi:hypothetical protein DFH29DRAFT_183318 [Suillus ampliporus]|nr:hypothetical protein DFH29DRAFT_183318 [Suillus ampliporus]
MSAVFDFSGKCVIVTGGNRGIGYACSNALAKAHSKVAIIYRSSETAPKVADELAKKHGVEVKAFKCDVTDEEKTNEMFAHINKEMGPVTGLIANAGVSVVKPALELTRGDFDKVFDVNVFGVQNSAKATEKLWINNKMGGSIVIMSSMSSEIINQAAPNKALTQGFYNASKAAVSQLAKELAVEWSPRVRVNTVSPGYVDTDQTRDMAPEIRQHQKENVPLKRFAEPKEIAPQALLLLSDDASYMTAGDYPCQRRPTCLVNCAPRRNGVTINSVARDFKRDKREWFITWIDVMFVQQF